MAQTGTMTDESNSSSNEDNHFHQNTILRVSNGDVFKKYELVHILTGSGSMGAVSTVRIKDKRVGGSAFKPKPKTVMGKIQQKLKKKSSHEIPSHQDMYALKSILLDRVSPAFLEELRNEINILRTMDHPNIVRAYEVYQTYHRNKQKQLYIVMELCSGGDLYTRSPYTEKQAAKLAQQLCSAVAYMHEHKIVHRDLKFENIMFANETDSSEIKVIDFGLSKKFLGKPGYMTERVGTIYTMAPQVLQGIYSSQADLWSIGVICYMLLSTTKPFMAKRRRHMVDQIMRGAVKFDQPIWKELSVAAQDFCAELLVVDPKERMNAPEALGHTWFVETKHLDNLPSERALEQIENSLIHYRQTSQLKKMALNLIAHRSTPKEIMKLRQAFDSFDTERNGVLSYREFKAALMNLKYEESEIEEIFSSIDLNQNGEIMYTEFLAATIEAHSSIEEGRIAEAFDVLDGDDSGFISKANLRESLGNNCSEEEIEEIIAAVDLDGDGKISYAEFLESFRKQTSALVAEVEQDIDASGRSSGHSRGSLLGLDAKIPGGRYDSHLGSTERRQADALL